MTETPKLPLLVISRKLDLHKGPFEATPLMIIKIYLHCFDPYGRQELSVPRRLLEALAKKFIKVMTGESNSLDEAFGGSVARQRNRLRQFNCDDGQISRRPAKRTDTKPLLLVFRHEVDFQIGLLKATPL